MEVVYNVSCKFKDNIEINERDIKDIVTRKLLKVILSLENNNSVTFNNS